MSNAIARIQEPVTGRERIPDPAQPEYALAQFYRALNARDLALMEQNWESSPEAAMDNPWDYTLHRGAEVFWVVGRERGRLTREGETLELAIRPTRLFRWNGERWRQAHHHGSIEDPQMLSRYLTAVRQVRQ